MKIDEDACFGAYLGHSQPSVPPIRHPKMNPSTMEISVVRQLRPYQIECCGNPIANDANPTVPATRKICGYAVPGP